MSRLRIVLIVGVTGILFLAAGCGNTSSTTTQERIPPTQNTVDQQVSSDISADQIGANTELLALKDHCSLLTDTEVEKYCGLSMVQHRINKNNNECEYKGIRKKTRIRENGQAIEYEESFWISVQSRPNPSAENERRRAEEYGRIRSREVPYETLPEIGDQAGESIESIIRFLTADKGSRSVQLTATNSDDFCPEAGFRELARIATERLK